MVLPQNISDHARQLHGSSIVIDAHSDVLKAVADGTIELGERTDTTHISGRGVEGHYDLPRWIEGGVTAQVCALYIDRFLLHQPVIRGLDMAACAYEEAEKNEQLVIAKTTDRFTIKWVYGWRA